MIGQKGSEILQKSQIAELMTQGYIPKKNGAQDCLQVFVDDFSFQPQMNQIGHATKLHVLIQALLIGLEPVKLQKLLKRKRMHLQFYLAPAQISGQLARQQLRIAAGTVDVKIPLSVIMPQNPLKRLHFLNLIYKQVIHLPFLLPLRDKSIHGLGCANMVKVKTLQIQLNKVCLRLFGKNLIPYLTKQITLPHTPLPRKHLDELLTHKRPDSSQIPLSFEDLHGANI